MISRQFTLFDKTIQRLGDSGILSDIILIGSWCLYFYRISFNNDEDIPILRTLDIDFLIKNPPDISRTIDVSQILREIGFIEEFSLLQGFSKFVHPELEIEFLTPEKGRGKDGIYKIDRINITAQGLRFLTLLQDNTIEIPYMGYMIKVPQPAAFVLHKFQISGKRNSKEKKLKDIQTAIELGEFIIGFPEHREMMKSLMSSLPVKWQKEIKTVIKENSDRIYEFYIGNDC